MKVLFKEHVINVGKKGEVKEVKSGFALNFLFPKNLAVELTYEEEKKLKEKNKNEENHRRELIENRHKIAELLNGKKLEFVLKSGENGKVYGGIGEKDIIGKIKKLYKIELSKKHISFQNGHIKKIGEEFVFIKLGKDAISKIIVVIKGE